MSRKKRKIAAAGLAAAVMLIGMVCIALAFAPGAKVVAQDTFRDSANQPGVMESSRPRFEPTPAQRTDDARRDDRSSDSDGDARRESPAPAPTTDAQPPSEPSGIRAIRYEDLPVTDTSDPQYYYGWQEELYGAEVLDPSRIDKGDLPYALLFLPAGYESSPALAAVADQWRHGGGRFTRYRQSLQWFVITPDSKWFGFYKVIHRNQIPCAVVLSRHRVRSRDGSYSYPPCFFKVSGSNFPRSASELSELMSGSLVRPKQYSSSADITYGDSGELVYGGCWYYPPVGWRLNLPQQQIVSVTRNAQCVPQVIYPSPSVVAMPVNNPVEQQPTVSVQAVQERRLLRPNRQQVDVRVTEPAVDPYQPAPYDEPYPDDFYEPTTPVATDNQLPMWLGAAIFGVTFILCLGLFLALGLIRRVRA